MGRNLNDPDKGERRSAMKTRRNVLGLGFGITMATLTFVCSVVWFGSAGAFGQTPLKVLMIPREGYSQDLDLMISKEIGVMANLLTSAGFIVDIATTSGSPIVGTTEKIKHVKRLAEVNVDDYAGLIMSCMAVGLFPGPPVAPEAVLAVQKTLASGKPVAAALGSVNVLAEAGVLKGKKYSYIRDPLMPDAGSTVTDRRFAGALYVSPGVTQDGQIITCGVCPNTEKAYHWGMDPFGTPSAPVGLTEMFIAAIKSR
jgi:putative intracellular protease/amidase